MNKITDDIEKLATECTNKLQKITGYNYVIKPSVRGIIQEAKRIRDKYNLW